MCAIAFYLSYLCSLFLPIIADWRRSTEDSNKVRCWKWNVWLVYMKFVPVGEAAFYIYERGLMDMFFSYEFIFLNKIIALLTTVRDSEKFQTVSFGNNGQQPQTSHTSSYLIYFV